MKSTRGTIEANKISPSHLGRCLIFEEREKVCQIMKILREALENHKKVYKTKSSGNKNVSYDTEHKRLNVAVADLQLNGS